MARPVDPERWLLRQMRLWRVAHGGRMVHHALERGGPLWGAVRQPFGVRCASTALVDQTQPSGAASPHLAPRPSTRTGRGASTTASHRTHPARSPTRRLGAALQRCFAAENWSASREGLALVGLLRQAFLHQASRRSER